MLLVLLQTSCCMKGTCNKYKKVLRDSKAVKEEEFHDTTLLRLGFQESDMDICPSLNVFNTNVGHGCFKEN